MRNGLRRRRLFYSFASILAVLAVSISVIEQSTRLLAIEHKHGRIIEDPTNVRSGAASVDWIPDDAALTVFFRVIADQDTPKKQKRLSAYVRFLMRLDGADCLDSHAAAAFVEPPEDAARATLLKCPVGSVPVSKVARVLAVGRKFGERSRPLEQALKASSPGRGAALPAHARATFLAGHQALLQETVAGLSVTVGPEIADRITDYVLYEMKRKMKIVTPRVAPSALQQPRSRSPVAAGVHRLRLGRQ